MRYSEYLKNLRSEGRRFFTTDDAVRDLQITENALRCAVYKLKQKNEIVSPAKGLYVIVPREYTKEGTLPANQLLPLLVKYWGLENYYVCLLSAARKYGAGHHAPQVYQVMSNKRFRPIKIGKTHIEFIYKKNLKKLPVNRFNTVTGELKISSPELTIYDLFHYKKHTGGLDNVLNIICEMIENINIESLFKLADQFKDKSWIQRLGYMIDTADEIENEIKEAMTKKIYEYIKNKMVKNVPLASGISINGKPKSEKWNIVINEKVESDL